MDFSELAGSSKELETYLLNEFSQIDQTQLFDLIFDSSDFVFFEG